jgi:hypothetical protein
MYWIAEVNKWKGSRAKKLAAIYTPSVETTEIIIWAKIGLWMFLKAWAMQTIAAAIM